MLSHLSVCLSVFYLFMYPPIINSSIHSPMHYPPTYPLNYLTSVCQPVCLSTYLPTFHSSMYPLTDSPIPVSTIFQLLTQPPTYANLSLSASVFCFVHKCIHSSTIIYLSLLMLGFCRLALRYSSSPSHCTVCTCPVLSTGTQETDTIPFCLCWWTLFSL